MAEFGNFICVQGASDFLFLLCVCKRFLQLQPSAVPDEDQEVASEVPDQQSVIIAHYITDLYFLCQMRARLHIYIILVSLRTEYYHRHELLCV